MISIVHRLRMAKGSNAKLSILKEHKYNELWKDILIAMYDDSINYYNSPPNDTTFIEDKDLQGWDMLLLLHSMANREYVGKAGKACAIEGSENYGEIFRLILGRSLKAGVSITTINKAYPDLIPTFDVMLARDVPVKNYPVFASLKYDGVRVIAMVHDGICDLYTRSGKSLDIKSLRYQMNTFNDGVYDGELVLGDGKQVTRTGISGLVNKCLKGTSDDIQNYTYCIFDYLALDQWRHEECDDEYRVRLSLLEAGYAETPTSNTRIVNQFRINRKEQEEEMFRRAINDGYEGTILRYPDGLYEWKRTDSLIKRKATKECVLTCHGIKWGTGKYEGMVGALICEGIVNDAPVRVSVGSGLSDHDREQSEEYYLDSFIEVLYNDIVKSKNSDISSLFLPRFKRKKGRVDT